MPLEITNIDFFNFTVLVEFILQKNILKTKVTQENFLSTVKYIVLFRMYTIRVIVYCLSNSTNLIRSFRQKGT
jgi:hypothetical protein